MKKKPVTKVRAIDEDAVVSRLGSNGTGKKRTASFQGLDNGSSSGGDSNTLPAVIHESQEVVSGSLVKMRLTEPALINGHQLPANTFIYGKCSLQGERLSIAIETLKSGNNVFPASLEVYDVDGLEGLHIPGAITRDAAKQAGASSMDATDMMTMSADPAMAAAGVAVTAAKNLGKNKIRLVKVRLKAGYNIMLKVDKD
ncbi:conjugative transposon protein TraM [Hymenobacter humi]|uniref:Conjugative transposon protein TraM n=1 Tax=Hymenobacter humi TaxID=1411620 RepID=A0ABW2UCQ7_9BACT